MQPKFILGERAKVEWSIARYRFELLRNAVLGMLEENLKVYKEIFDKGGEKEKCKQRQK